MFKYKGFDYNLDKVTQVEEAAKQSSMSLGEYVSEYGLVKTEDEGKTNGVAQTDAAVAPVPEQASESTESESVDISSESQPIDNSQEAILKRRKLTSRLKCCAALKKLRN